MARVITFYSYKGGTGRSMALANVAWVLASCNRRVLVIDWDLEAPGLHHYLRPFLPDPTLAGYGVQGVIDLVLEYAAAATTPPSDSKSSTSWWLPYANFGQSAIRLRWPSGEPLRFGERGAIDFVPAGRQSGEEYASRVNSFDWKHFYQDLHGGGFFNSVRASFSTYDYVLIDSRTGVSDTSGICTIQLPDSLVLCFTLNNQSIAGAAASGLSIRSQRPSMPIFPVPMRVDPFEKDRLNRRREYAHDVFGKFVKDLPRLEINSSLLDNYWDIEVPYFASYAYEEILSPFEQFSRNVGSLLPCIERLARVVTNDDVSRLGATPDESELPEVRSEYAELPLIDTAVYPPSTSKRRPVPRRWVGVATAAWSLLALFVIWRTYATLSSQSQQQLLGALLVSYAGAHEAEPENAASALAAAQHLPVSPLAREIALRLIEKGIPFSTLHGSFNSAAVSPDNRSVAVTASSTVFSLRSFGTKATLWSVVAVDPSAGIEFSSDGTKIVTLEAQAVVWDTARGARLWKSTYDIDTSQALQSGFSTDGRYWNLKVQQGKRIFVAEYLRSAGTGNPIDLKSEFPDKKFPSVIQLMDKTLSADGSLVAMTDGRTVSVWRLPAEDQAIRSQNLPQDPPVIHYAFNASVTRMLLASEKSGRVWDLTTNRFLGEIHFDQTPSLLALSPRGDAAALSFPDGSVVVYQGPQFAHTRTVKGFKLPLRSLKFSADGTLFYTLYSGANAGDPVDSASGVYLWSVNLPDLPPNPSWPQLAAYLKAASGNCLSPAARQEIYGEKADVAIGNFNQCRSSQ